MTTNQLQVHIDDPDNRPSEEAEMTRILSENPKLIAIDSTFTSRSGATYKITRIEVRKPDGN